MADTIEHLIRESKVLVMGKHPRPSDQVMSTLADHTVVIDLEQMLNQGISS